MSEWTKLLLYFIGSVALAAVLAPFIIRLMSSLKAKQTVLGYVTQHAQKSGTPTMGGFIFLIPALIFSLIEVTALSAVALAVTAGFCVLGFLDDFIKVKYSRNLGLKAYQKIIGQLGISAIVAYFVYSSQYVGTTINVPFLSGAADLSWGIIPFCIIIFLATTNSVNLTDGLDGLAGYTSIAYFFGFALILFFAFSDAQRSGDALYARQMFGLTVFCVSMLGGLCGYVLFNSYPASIMMGDTGSLALGAAAACVAIFSKNPLLIVTSGIMFVWSSISVILQVTSFKLTKKRVFLMAPFHHHLEMRGFHESRIVALYFVISLVFAAVSLIFARAI